MFKKIKLSSTYMRQALSLAMAILLVGSVSYLGEQFYRSSHAATGASMSVNPATASPAVGSTLTVTIRENSGTDTVNSVQSAVNYDSSQLQYLGMSDGDFTSVAATKTTTGNITVARYTTGSPLTGDHAVITLNFNVLASSGTTTISIDSANSGVNRSTDDTNILAVVTNGTYTISTSTTASATLSMQPASGTYAKGATFNMEVVENSSAHITVVEPIIQYDATQLQFVKITNSTAFPTAAVDQTANGVLDITRAISGGSAGVTGNNIVFTVQFKVLGGSGNTALSFKSTSDIEDDSKTGKNMYNASGSQGALYTLTGDTTAVTTTPPATSPSSTQSASGGTDDSGSSGSSTGTVASYPLSVITRSGGLSVSTGAGSTGSVSQTGNATQVQGQISLTPAGIRQIATTGDSIVKVEYYLDDTFISTSTTAPYAYKFDTTKLRNGHHTVSTKTYYQSGTSNSTKDSIIVHNPVTLGYVMVHYTSQISLTLIAVALGCFAFWRFILPSARGRFALATPGYDGYEGYVSPAMTKAPTMPEAPEPTVITPSNVAAQPVNFTGDTQAVQQQGQIQANYIPQSPSAQPGSAPPGTSIAPDQANLVNPTEDPNHPA